MLVERAVELSDVRGVEISEGHTAGVVVRAAFQDHDVEVRHIFDVGPLPVREVLVGTVTDFQVLVVVDAVVDDSRVVRHQDRAADSTVVDTGAGLLTHSLRDSVVHGGRSVGRADDQRVSHKEDFLTLQLVLPEAETGVISALLCDGGVALGGLLPAHGLDRDELRARLFQDVHGLVLLDVPGLGVRSAAGAAALRFHGSGSAQVGRVAFGVVVAVVDVVLERVRHVLEGQLIVEGSLFQTDDARSIQFERTADIVVRRIRFTFRRGSSDDTKAVFRNGTDVIEPCVLARVRVVPVEVMGEAGGLAVHRRDLAVFARRRRFHVDLVPVDTQVFLRLHGVPGEFCATARVADDRTGDRVFFIVDGGVFHDLAVLDDIHDAVQHERAVVAEVHFTVPDVPGTELIGRDAVVVEVDRAVLDAPPAELVLCHAGVVEVDGTVLEVPPAVFVLRDTGVVRDSSAVLHAPPAFPVLDGALSRATVADLDLAVVQQPERRLPFGFGDLLTPLIRIDGTAVLLRHDVVQFEEAVKLEVDLASGNKPVAVIVVKDAMGFEVDLAGLHTPPAIAVGYNAVVSLGLRGGAFLIGIPLTVFTLADFQV